MLKKVTSHLVSIYTNDLDFSLGNELIQLSSFEYINKRVNTMNNGKCFYIGLLKKTIYSVVFLTLKH